MARGNIFDILGEKPQEPKTKKKTIHMEDVTELHEDPRNFYSTEDLEDLENSIAEVGIKQNILIRIDGEGKKWIVAGHRRCRATRNLVQQGREDRRLVPCEYVERSPLEDKYGDEGREIYELQLLLETNNFRDKTDYEKMEEIFQKMELAKRLKNLGEITGSVRKYTSGETKVSEGQIGRYMAIRKNLYPGIMEWFRKNLIPVSVAEELAKLPEQWQQDALDLIQANKGMSLDDAKLLRKKAEEEEQIDGQVDIEQAMEALQEKTYDAGIQLGDQYKVFYDHMGKNVKKLCREGDVNLLAVMLYNENKAFTWYTPGEIDFAGRGDVCYFGWHTESPLELTWYALAQNLINRYGEKKTLNIVPINEPYPDPEEVDLEEMSESDNFKDHISGKDEPKSEEEDLQEDPEERYTMADVLRVLASAEDFEKQVEACEGMPRNVLTKHRIEADALRLLRMTMTRPAEPVQQPLPRFKNDDQRKEWLENYRAWGIWKRDEDLDINYYKYDFDDNGTRIIVDEYPQRDDAAWSGEHRADLKYYHLIQKDKPRYNRKGTYDKAYVHSGDSMTYLVGFLKEFQRGA